MVSNRLWVILKPELVDGRLWANQLVAHLVLLVICILDEDFAFGALRIRVLPHISRGRRCYSRESSARSSQRLYNIVYLEWLGVSRSYLGNSELKEAWSALPRFGRQSGHSHPVW